MNIRLKLLRLLKVQSFSGIVLASLLLPLGSSSYANWTFNVGYHNPPQAGLGVNFLYGGSQFAVELGIGSVQSDANFDNDKKAAKDDGVALGIGGDINAKAFFSSGGVRPYVQAGMLLGTSGSLGDNSGFGVGSGSVFAGGGLWLGQLSSVHGYLSYNVLASTGFLQAGIGFDI
jgi:hypothetical protein